jgi:hypothetical protein
MKTNRIKFKTHDNSTGLHFVDPDAASLRDNVNGYSSCSYVPNPVMIFRYFVNYKHYKTIGYTLW